MGDDRQAKLPELRGRAAVVAIALVVIALLGGSWWGWSYAGPLGGLLGVLLGTAVGALAFTIVRAAASTRRFGDRPAPDVRELPPDQAMRVLTAMMSAGSGTAPGSGDGRGAMSFEGGLLGQLARARARAEGGDLDGALASLRMLAEQHPRSPAVPAEITRLLAGNEAHGDERTRAAGKAISLAIHGGMYRLAAQLFEELDEAERERLGLAADEWDRLAKIFSARGDEHTAALCHERAAEP